MAAERPTEDLNRRAGRGIAWAAAGRIGRATGQIVFIVFLGRAIGPMAFGAATIAFIGYQLVVTVATQSYSQSLVHAKREGVSSARSTAFWLNLGLTGLIVIAIVAASAPAARLLALTELSWLGPLMAGIGFIAAPTVISQATLSAALDFRRIAQIETLGTLAGTLTGLATLLSGLEIIALVVFALAQRLVELLLFLRIGGALPAGGIERHSAARLSRFTLPLVGMQVLTILNNSIDQIFVGAVTSAQTLGHFGLARRLTQQPAQMITFAIGRAMFPSLVRAMREEGGDARALFMTWVRLALVIATFPLFLLAVCAEDFVAMALGPDWSASVPFLQLFAAVSALLPIGGVFSAALRATGRTDLQFAIAAGRAVVSLATLWLVAHFGGGAWQMALATAVIAMVLILAPGIVATSALGVHRGEVMRGAAAGLAPALAAAAVGLALSVLLPTYPPWARLVLIAAGALVAWLPVTAATNPEIRAFSMSRRRSKP